MNTRGSSSARIGIWHFAGLLLVYAAQALAQTPLISSRPLSKLISAGQPISITVGATGAEPLAYQWERNGQLVPDVTGPTLTRAGATVADKGYYRVRVSNADGEATTVFSLLVAPPNATLVRWNSSGALAVPGVSGTVAAVAASSHEFGLRTDGTVFSLGGFDFNGVGQVPAGLSDVVAIATNGGNAVALKSDGFVVSWGASDTFAALKPPGSLSNVVAVAAGEFHSLALKSDGTVVGWGNNQSGKISVPASTVPYVAVAASSQHSSLLRADGTLVVLGDNESGHSSVPAGLGAIVAVVEAPDHSIALRADGTVVTWGGTPGQNDVPGSLAGVTAITGGYRHSLALKADRTLVGWGTAALPIPAGLGNVLAAVAGVERTYALLDLPNPSVLVPPSNQFAPAGATATFSATVTGTPPITLRWLRNGVDLADGPNIAGATTPTLTLSNVQPAAAGNYALAATNAAGTNVSASATLTVGVPPTITTQPASQTLPAGSTATFSVSASRTSSLVYQWKFNGLNLTNGGAVAGATTSTLTLANLQEDNAGAYTVVVSDPGGTALSNEATLAVTGPPVTPLIRQQTGALVGWGSSPINLEVTAASTMSLTYQWYQGRGGDTTTPVSGATQAALQIPAGASSRYYWAQLTNPAGAADSQEILVMPWVPRDAGLGSGDLIGASYANGRFFVSASESGAFSVDGLTWTPFNKGFALRPGSKVAYGHGVYVAGGGSTGGSIYSSSDGANWVTRSSGQSSVINRVIFDGAVFVAVGESGRISTSADGLNWTVRDSSSSLSLNDVAHGGGMGVAVGLGGRVAVSNNSESWTNLPAFTNHQFLAVTYGQGRFVALAGPGLNANFFELWTSENGTNWSQRSLPVLANGAQFVVGGGNDVVFGGGEFVAALNQHLIYSGDGINWSATPGIFPAQTSHGNSLAYGNGRFLSAGEGGVILQTLPLETAAKISTSTASHFILPGTATTLAVTPDGPGLSFQWYLGPSGNVSQPIAGATAAEFQTPSLSQGQSYWVRVFNADGAVDSATIAVSVATVPTLTTNTAREVEVVAGHAVSFGVQVGGAPAPALQWYRGPRGDTSSPVGGATTAALTVSAGTTVERFWVRATNLAGSVDSDAFRYTPWVPTQGGRFITHVRQLGDTLVAVGGSEVLTSTDGRGWLKRATINNSNLRDIIEHAGLYVAVGERGFFTSTDLATWTQRNLPTTPDYTGALSIARGNGKFVAVGVGHSTSTDGINWSSFTIGAGIQLESVVFDGSRFVGVGQVFEFNNEARQRVGVIFHSTDGVAWTRVALEVLPETIANAATELDRLVYAGGKYLATSSSANCLLVSSDTTTWTRYDLGFVEGSRLRTSAFAAGSYLVGTEGSGYLVSTDAINWSPMVGPAGLSGRSLLTTSTGVLAVAQTGTTFNSVDAANWTQLSGVPASLGSVTYGHGTFLSVGADPRASLYVSEDGLNWSVQRPSLTGQGGEKVAYHGGRFYLTTGEVGLYYRSIDGLFWDLVRTGTTATYQGIVSAGAFVYSLTDTLTKDVAFGQGRYVAVGQSIATSTNGANWTPATSVPSGTFNAVAYGNGQFVAVGSPGLIATSTDGSTWTQRIAPNPVSGHNDIVYSGDRFLVATTAGLVFSLDGISWQLAPDLGNQAQSLTLGGGYVLATGSGAMTWRRAMDGIAVGITALTSAQEIEPGGSTTLTVSAMGTGLAYQWYRGFAGDTSSPIEGATSAALITPPANSKQRYWVKVIGDGGATESATILVELRGPPSVVLQPFSADVLAGTQSVTLSVMAESSRPLTYQWFYGEPGSTLFPVGGGTGRQLLIRSLSHRTRYWVRITNEHGSTNSLAAEVTPWVSGQFATGSPAFLTTGGIAYGNDRFVLVGASEGANLPGAVQVSTDAENWTMIQAPALGSIAFGGGRFVATSRTPAARIYGSPDGATWTSMDLPAGAARFTGMFFVGNRFVAVSDTGAVATSTDGTNWNLVQVGSQRLYSAAYGNGVYVLSGAGGALFKSVDGNEWTPVTSPTTRDLVTMAFGANQFIALTADATAFASSSGTAWAPGPVVTHDYYLSLRSLHALSFADNRFFGGTKSLTESSVASTDGFSWGRGLAKLARAVSANGKLVGTNETITVTLTAGGANVNATGGGYFRALAALPVPEITLQPASQTVDFGSTVTLSVTVTGAGPFVYQWFRNGAPVTGATAATLPLGPVTASNAGNYTVTVASPAGAVTSTPATVTIHPLSQPGLVNGAALTHAGVGATLQAAFTIEGAPKQMLIRAVGPTLGSFAISGFMVDPRLSIIDASSNEVAGNDDWESAANASQMATVSAQVGVYPLLAGGKDAALLATLAPGTYRVRLEDGVAAGGAVSLEVYETDGQPRLVYLATPGIVGGDRPALVQGFVVTAPVAGRSYLIRALGPALGSMDALPDPQLTIFSGSTVLATSDNWGGAAALSAASVGGTSLRPLSRDAALEFVPPSAGTFTAELTGVGGATGAALLEIFEVDSKRTAAAPVAIVSPPQALTVDAGQPASFGVVAVGPSPLSFEWRKEGAALNGATSPTWVLPSAQIGDAGNYSVRVAGNGSEVFVPVTLGVNPANNASHAARDGLYAAGGALTITNTLHYVGSPTSLGWSAQLPSGWTLAGDGGNAGDVKPAVGATGTISWTWTTLPPSPVTFTYVLNVPSTASGDQSISASATVNAGIPVLVKPDPLLIGQLTRHSADTNGNDRIDVAELSRVITLYNARFTTPDGKIRTGAYAVATATTADGFAPDAARDPNTTVALARYHSADTNHNGRVDVSELSRVITLYNTRFTTPDGKIRTGFYKLAPGTLPDGFAPDPTRAP